MPSACIKFLGEIVCHLDCLSSKKKILQFNCFISRNDVFNSCFFSQLLLLFSLSLTLALTLTCHFHHYPTTKQWHNKMSNLNNFVKQEHTERAHMQTAERLKVANRNVCWKISVETTTTTTTTIRQ